MDSIRVRNTVLLLGAGAVIGAVGFASLATTTTTVTTNTVTTTIDNVDDAVVNSQQSDADNRSASGLADDTDSPSETGDVTDDEPLTKPAWMMHALFASYDPKDYPPASYERKVLPSFTGSQRPYAAYKSAIYEAIRKSPNLSGSYRVLTLGCGTGCSFAYVIDDNTGHVYDFDPHGGGEEAPAGDTWYSKDSSLVYDVQRDGDRCVYTVYHFDHGDLKQLARDSKDAGTSDDYLDRSGNCPA